MTKKTALQIFKTGKMSDMTIDHVCDIVENLYYDGLAHAFFIGMGWPEGYHYCQNRDYVRLTVAPAVLENKNNEKRAYWFAIGFMDK